MTLIWWQCLYHFNAGLWQYFSWQEVREKFWKCLRKWGTFGVTVRNQLGNHPSPQRHTWWRKHYHIQEFIYQTYPSPSIQGRAPVAPNPPAWSPLPTDSSCGAISDLLPSQSSPWGCWATCRTACIILITRITTLMWFTYGSQHKSPTVLHSLGHYYLISISYKSYDTGV